MNKHLLTSLFIGLIISLSGCSKKEVPKPTYAIDNSSLSINYDNEHQFIIKLGNGAADAGSFTWTSSDTTVGTINKTGLFKGKKIGKTTVKAEGNGTALISEVTINPYRTMFKEPVTAFGAPIDTIKSKEIRKFDEEIDGTIYFQGENANVQFVGYTFSNNKMTSAGIFFQPNNAVIEELPIFYNERYTYMGKDGDYNVFSGDKYMVGIGQNNNSIFALYIPASETKTMTTKSLNSRFNEKLQEIKLKNLSK